MELRTIDRDQVIERYVLGRLSAEEAEAFEEYFFEHPGVLDEVEAAMALREGLLEHPSMAPVAFWRSPLATAASLVACVGLAAASYLYVENRQLEGMTILAAHNVSERVLLSASRSVSSEGVAVSAGANALLEVAVGPLGFHSYDLVIRNSAGEELYRSARLQLDDDFALAVATGNLIAPGGRYELVVSARRAAGQSADTVVAEHTLLGV
ncbi:MAG: hypothetical protein NXH85_02320 [Pseudomonadaceae bacterium]|nr:hypothetical protein [Pseudomonadaceae bacterium]